MKTMGKKYIFAALAGAIAMLTSCSDEFGQQFTPANTGDYIVFGGRAGFQMDDKESKTRTIYTGDFYTVGDKKYEKVHWVAGDKVSIYCNEASGLKSVDYKVTAENPGVDADETNNYHDTGLIPSETENGLQWGNTSTDHTFYAVYPNTGITYNSSDASATVTATLPDIQTPEEITYSNGKWVAKPDMDYAYMIAKTTVSPTESGNSVNLQFMPLVTAVEITLTNLAQETKITDGTEGKVGYDFNLTNVIITTTDKSPIYGEFSLDIADMTDSDSDGIADAIPTVTNNSAASTNYAITIPMYNDADGDGTNGPALLKYGESLTFTVFMLHNADLNSLNVTIQGVQGTKTGTIGGSSFLIQKNKKTYLRNLPLTDDILPFNQSNWIKYLEDNAIVRTLSIPGAGGAASSALTAGGTTTLDGVTYQHDMIRQQDLTIAELWDKGVRCFEFAVDITSDGSDIGAKPVLSGGLPCGDVTLTSAVTAVKEQLLAHPEEFAMVILTYQTLGGWAGNDDVTRSPSSFMTQINTFWKDVIKAGTVWQTTNGIEVTTALYNPANATVATSRGKLFCIARPTSIHEDYGEVLYQNSGSTNRSTGYVTDIPLSNLGTLTPHEHIMLIQGWGALKDKWQQRGYSKYSIRGTAPVSDVEIYKSLFSSISVDDDKPGRPFDVSTMTVSADFDWSSMSYTNFHWEGDVPVINNYTINTNSLTPDFSYDIVSSSGTTASKAWVQEWARVSKMQDVGWFNFSTTGISKDNPGTNRNETATTAYWADSYNEKLGHVKDALSYAINKTKGDIVYINSLCGYFIDEAIHESLDPCILTDRNIKNENETLTSASRVAGMAGDIASFATEINQDFYDHIMTIGDENGYQAGSMGIVLMDRISSEVNSVGSKIPGIIVANNFQTTQVATTATTLSLPLADLEEGDVVAAPQRRSASEESDEVKIVWE